MEEQPEPKHQLPEGLTPQEVSKGVPILAYQIEILTLLADAKAARDLLLDSLLAGQFKEGGTL